MSREITTSRRVVVGDRNESREVTVPPEDFETMKLPAIEIDLPSVAAEIAGSFAQMVGAVVSHGIPYGASSDVTAELARQDADGSATKITITVKTGPRTI
jgi:hypothetical protein